MRPVFKLAFLPPLFSMTDPADCPIPAQGSGKRRFRSGSLVVERDMDYFGDDLRAMFDTSYEARAGWPV